MGKLDVATSASRSLVVSSGWLDPANTRIAAAATGGVTVNIPLEIEGAPIQFVSGGTGNETMRITPQGYVGIGTSNPLSPFEVVFDNITPGLTNDLMVSRYENTNDWSPMSMRRARHAGESSGIAKWRWSGGSVKCRSHLVWLAEFFVDGVELCRRWYG